MKPEDTKPVDTKLTGIFLYDAPSEHTNNLMMDAINRLWQAEDKVGECVKIMAENEGKVDAELQGLIWESLLVTLEKWNDAELLNIFHTLCPDPEGL